MFGLGDHKRSEAATAAAASAARPGDNQPTAPASLMAKRARQIQADEGVLLVNRTFKPPSIADDADPIIPSSSSSRSNKGRARAGTLPSSWGDALPTLQVSAAPDQPSQRPVASGPGQRLAPGQPQGLSSRVGPANLSANPHVHLDNNNISRLGAQATASQRLRSGSLTLPSANLGNAFGPTFFSSNWQPTRSGLSNMTVTSEEDPALHPAAMDELAAHYTFDGSDTLDYLGLAGAAGGLPGSAAETNQIDEAFIASNNLRNRSHTLSVQHPQRPRLGDTVDGRARSSSFLPSFHLDTVEDAIDKQQQQPRTGSLSGNQTPYGGPQQQSLFNAALQNRLNQYSGASPAHLGASMANSSPGTGISAAGQRPRATSMGVLDIHQRGFQTDTSHVSPRPTEEDYGFPAEVAMQTPLPHLASDVAGARNRAGTIAAFPGPGGRQRTEQELLRMTQMPHEAVVSRMRAMRPSSSGILESSGSAVEPFGSTRGMAKTRVSASGTASPYSQPVRSLWVGALRANVTSQDLLQVFSHYGAIETFRLVPEKGCAFVNFVDINDAVRAKDDIGIRLGGRIGLGSPSSDGRVRVGFGRPDAVPQTGITGSFPMSYDSHSSGFSDANVDVSVNQAQAADFANATPTRALWIGAIPASTSMEILVSIFSPFGPIESVRIVSNKSCGFVNFERLDDAIVARKALHGRDVLGPEVGAVRIGFAKVPNKPSEAAAAAFDPSSPDFQAAMEALATLQGASAVPLEAQLRGGNLKDYRSNLVMDALSRQASQPSTPPAHVGLSRNHSHDRSRIPSTTSGRVSGFPTHSSSNSIVPSSDKGGVPLPMEMKPRASTTDLQLLMRQLDESDANVEHDVELVARQRPLVTYYTRIPAVPELPPGKKFDNNRLKELRGRVEDPSATQMDVDHVARDFLPSIVDLSSDFIGNTLVQKFFERCSEGMKGAMLELIAPHLAMIGVHKNGTWAAQKIIDCTRSEGQRALIAQHLRPYVPPLLTDQFGNYVVQRLIPFGSPWSDFIFDAMVDRCWEIAQGRYGARSMRTCLESANVSRCQIKRVALAIVLNSVPLATSMNGALLVTWLLDASTLPGRFRLLAPRLTPHLANLCTHKLASQTIYRIVSQDSDVEASRQILRALFDPSRTQLLQEILTDQVHGSQFVSKIMAEPNFLDASQREHVSEEIRSLLLRHNLVNMPPYRPISIRVGLLDPSASTPGAYPSAPQMADSGRDLGMDSAQSKWLDAQHHALDRHFSMMSMGNPTTGVAPRMDGGSHSTSSFAPFGPAPPGQSLPGGAFGQPSTPPAAATKGSRPFGVGASAFDPWAPEPLVPGNAMDPRGTNSPPMANPPNTGHASSSLLYPPAPSSGYAFDPSTSFDESAQQAGFPRRPSPLGHGYSPRPF
ncbi:hypothetical protein BCV70DRAFT_214278 [Testicularia cyperi]|uniref:ARM repeat-containing protein n=1 Tax=Testicularia cyperi TaxID=1882483 RepID=A0A317XWR2_9BASI|nr:hypothetical protein BCV70DRAFT_214278 [Testicularia cyperi]